MPLACLVAAETEKASFEYLLNKNLVMEVFPAPEGAVRMMTLFCMNKRLGCAIFLQKF